MATIESFGARTIGSTPQSYVGGRRCVLVDGNAPVGLACCIYQTEAGWKSASAARVGTPFRSDDLGIGLDRPVTSTRAWWRLPVLVGQVVPHRRRGSGGSAALAAGGLLLSIGEFLLECSEALEPALRQAAVFYRRLHGAAGFG